MSVKRYDPFSVLEIMYFYEDFPGVAYNTRIWSARGGSGSVALSTDGIGGQVRVRANASNYYELYISIANLSTSRKLQQNWRVKLPNLTSVTSSWGLCGSSSPAEAIAFRYDSATSANWLLVSTTGSSSTIIDTSVVADTNFHEFNAAGNTGVITCFIDNVPVGNMIATLPSASLSPFCRTTSLIAATKDTLIDWIEIYGERV